MRSSTEIPPLLTQGVERDWLNQSFENFQFVGFVLSLDSTFCFVTTDFNPLQRELAANNFPHLLLDCLEIGFREGFRIVEVVIKP